MIGSMEGGSNFIPPSLTPAIRKRPILDPPSVIPPIPLGEQLPSRPHQETPTTIRPIGSKSTTTIPPPPMPMEAIYSNTFQNRANPDYHHSIQIQSNFQSDTFVDQELKVVGRALESFRHGYLGLTLRYSALQQEATALQTRTSIAEEGWRRERNSVQRSQENCMELQHFVDNLLERLKSLAVFKKSVEEKGQNIENLVLSLKQLKAQMSERLSSLESECQKQREKVLNLEDKIVQTQVEQQGKLESVQLEHDRIKGNLETIIAERDDQISDLKRVAQQTQDYLYTVEASKTAFESNVAKLESNFMNYQKGLYLLIKNVASNLGCRSPASYGDGSLEAIENVLKEILEEHGSIEKSKMEDLNVASEKSKQQYDKALETIESLKESVKSSETVQKGVMEKYSALESDNEAKMALIRKLEKRMAEQQIESGSNAAKLADLQKLRVLAGLLDEFFDGQASQMEYEDMRCILMERLSHEKCQAEIASLEDKINVLKEEKERSNMVHQEFIRDAALREKTLEEKIHSMLVTFEGEKKIGTPTAAPSKTNNKERDKTVESLIELIERDTQDLRGIQTRSMTTPSIRERRQRSRTSSRPRKRSPSSNHSELDLWAVFAKRP